MQIEFDDIVINRKLLIQKNSIRIAENAITVIEGENGTGKTVLLHRLFSLCAKMNIPVSLVEQGNDYFWRKSTVLENICLSESEEGITKAHCLLAEFQLEHLENHEIKELSGGEKRILCIIRAIYHMDHHGIVFIDEPTNDLDMYMVSRLKDYFVKLKKDISLVIVSHDDRILTIADEKYTISNRQLWTNCIIKQLGDSGLSDCENVSTDNHSKWNALIQNECLCKSIMMKGLLAVIALIFALISIYGTVLITEPNLFQKTDCKEREFDIMIPTTIIGGGIISSEAVPIRMLSLLQKELSIGKKIQIYNDVLSTELPINYGLNEFISEESNHIIFALEFFNPVDDEFIYPMDYYCKMKGIDPNVEIYNSLFFSINAKEDEEPDGVIEFDADAFQKCVKKTMEDYREKNLQCTFLSIVLDENETVDSFINNSSIKELFEGNYYVRSAEIASFVQQMESMINRRKAMSFSLVLSICILFLGIILIVIGLYSSRKTLLVARDVNADKESIIRSVRKHMSSRKPVAVILAAVTIGNTILIWNKGEISIIGNYLCLLTCVCSVILLYGLLKIITSFYVKYLWGWKRR